MYAPGLVSRGGVGALDPMVQPVEKQVSGLHLVDDRVVVPEPVALEAHDPLRR